MSIEKFNDAFSEIQVTTDPYRYAYLKWIGYHMWKLFDYDSATEVINSEEKYRQWQKPGRSELAEEARQSIKHRDETGEPVTLLVKLGIFPKN
ncbi:MAG: hypothetical protein DRQ44_00815 [Gammaproteobacteria bacterium]|nr:MAG: hypothetical protein DRQ44_00815 [Gammaproteobacteria bacterium]